MHNQQFVESNDELVNFGSPGVQGSKADKLEEACGVFGIFGEECQDVTRLTYYALYALQHRGQEAAGIAVADGQGIKVHKGPGLVSDVFDRQIIASLKGKIAIGHVLYAKEGKTPSMNAEPLLCNYLHGSLAIAHNGCFTNAKELKSKLAGKGSVFQAGIDSELLANLLAHYNGQGIVGALQKAMQEIIGSYALVIMTDRELIGVRDPYGNRPLCIGKLGDAYLLSSESCAFEVLGAELVRDVEPGEIVLINEKGLHSFHCDNHVERALCVFEFIYFARPDSDIDRINVMEARRAMGRQLAKEKPVDVDLVIPVPDSGIAGGLGYAEGINCVFEMGLIKNRYIARTFIRPEQSEREIGVRLKLNPVTKLVKGKKVGIVDDSIVRGTTSKKIVQMLRNSGAKEVHMLITSPPVIAPCYYGIDTSERNQLIAGQKSLEEIREYIGADSLSYLSLEGLFHALGQRGGFCAACLNDQYPIDIPSDRKEEAKEEKKCRAQQD
jgi:amidophosphoribosyltransferase